MKRLLPILLLLACGCAAQRHSGYIHVVRAMQVPVEAPAYAAHLVGGAAISTDYPVTIDDTGDNTAVVQAAINFVAGQAGNGPGGKIHLCAGKIRHSGVLTIPNTGGNTPTQPTIIIEGEGANDNGADKPNTGGTTLDVRGTGTAKLYTSGTGLLVLRDFGMADDSTGAQQNTTPYIYTTLTTIHAEHISGTGNPAKSLNTCDQDFIVCGGTSLTFDGTANAPFSGYGSSFEHVYIDRMRRLALCQSLCNGVVFRDCHWGVLTGSNLAGGAAWESVGHDNASTANMNSGLVVIGCTFELPGYVYGVKLTNSHQCSLCNNFYDPHVADSTHPGSVACARFESSSPHNTLINGSYSQFAGCALASDAVAFPNGSLVIDSLLGTISGATAGSLSGAGFQEFTATSTDFNSRTGMFADQFGGGGFRAGTTLDANAYFKVAAAAGVMALEPYGRSVEINGRHGSSSDAGNRPALIVRNSSTQTGKVLVGRTSDGLTDLWGFGTNGELSFNSFNPKVAATKSGAYTAANETIVPVTTGAGGVTITLPLASTQAGRIYIVKKVTGDGNALTIARSGSDTIDGAASQGGSSAYVAFRFFSDGTNWFSY